MPSPGSYAAFLLIIGLAGAAGGVEGEQKIAIIFILLFARLQLRLQLRCIHIEAVENPHNFLLYLQRRNRYDEFSHYRTIQCRNTCMPNFTNKIMLISSQIII